MNSQYFFAVVCKDGSWYGASGRSGAIHIGPRLYMSEGSAKRVATSVRGTYKMVKLEWEPAK